MVDVPDTDSNDGVYEVSYDIGVLSIDTFEACEVLANVMFQIQRPDGIRGKVNTGAMVTCMPLSILCDIGLDEKDLAPNSSHLHGVTGTDMNIRGEVTVQVSFNSHSKIKILVNELGTELILGFNFCKLFNLIAIADAFIQRNITLYEQ